MPHVYSSKSTPILFADAPSAAAWQRHVVDGAPADVYWTEHGYVVENQRAKESLSYAQLADRFTFTPASLLDETPIPVCGDRLSRYSHAFAQGFYRE